jgi:xanthine dehydrogenase accessory factor
VVELLAILRYLSEHPEGGEVLATLVDAAGSSYRRPGARLLIISNTDRIGSISGGCLEEDLIARSLSVAGSGKPEVVTYDTTSENDLVWGVGLGCHGVVKVLLEKLPPRPRWVSELSDNIRNHQSTQLSVIWSASDPDAIGTHLEAELPSSGSHAIVFRQELQPPVRLYIFGAGDDARPLVRFSKELGWNVTVADPRASFAVEHRFPSADTVVTGRANDLVGLTNPPFDALAVVMTHHYVHDLPILKDLLRRPLRYVGLLGPKKRAQQILTNLRTESPAITAETELNLRAPVGLDLGADTPEQVALSIIAEMQAVIAQRNARPLRERTGPIHNEPAHANPERTLKLASS